MMMMLMLMMMMMMMVMVMMTMMMMTTMMPIIMMSVSQLMFIRKEKEDKDKIKLSKIVPQSNNPSQNILIIFANSMTQTFQSSSPQSYHEYWGIGEPAYHARPESFNSLRLVCHCKIKVSFL